MDNFANIYIVIVSFNGMSNNWIPNCLETIKQSTIKAKTLVIDNDSTDQTVDFIKSNYPDVVLIESKTNHGFAHANNMGIEKALGEGAEFILLLNQDGRLYPDTIEILVNQLKANPNFGILSPIHLNQTGELLDSAFFNYLSRKNYQEQLFITDSCKQNFSLPIYEFDFINAACWLISRACIESVGLFDAELFPHYGEDNDFVIRARQNNFKLGLVPSVFFHHDRFELKTEKSQSLKFSRKSRLSKFKLYQKHEPQKMTSYYLKEIIRLPLLLVTRPWNDAKQQMQLISDLTRQWLTR